LNLFDSGYSQSTKFESRTKLLEHQKLRIEKKVQEENATKTRFSKFFGVIQNWNMSTIENSNCEEKFIHNCDSRRYLEYIMAMGMRFLFYSLLQFIIVNRRNQIIIKVYKGRPIR
jgi:hypothetical protein